MKLLIVVDKLLTGFDAPPATYLYIDKSMRDHGLFQAICRVNRLDGEDKEYGYVVDYKDLFQSLEGAIEDYTGGALDGYDREDVAGLLKDRLATGRERLEETIEAVRALCEPVAPPRDTPAFLHYFCAADTADRDALKENEPRRVALYKHVGALVRAYAEPRQRDGRGGLLRGRGGGHQGRGGPLRGRPEGGQARLRATTSTRRCSSRPCATSSTPTSAPTTARRSRRSTTSASSSSSWTGGSGRPRRRSRRGSRRDPEAMAETIENNVRRVIIDEQDGEPEVLRADVGAARRPHRGAAGEGASTTPRTSRSWPTSPGRSTGRSRRRATRRGSTPAPRRALYDNLGGDADLAVRIDEAVRSTKRADWRGNRFKEKEVLLAVREALGAYEAKAPEVFELVKAQDDY